MIDKGYIRLHRKILDWYGFKSGNRIKLWITILILANHEDKRILYNGKPMTIKRGTFVTSRRKLSLITDISDSYIENLLSEFVLQQQIRQDTCSTSRLIVVLNHEPYNKEQPRKQPRAGQQKDHEQDTTKHYNIKEDTNVVGKEATLLLTAFKTLFERGVGSKYVPNYAKDTILLKGLLKELPKEKILELMGKFFESQDEFIQKSGYSVGVFKSQINKLNIQKPKSMYRQL